MGAVDDAVARVLDQHALQAQRQALRLAVAEHDDRRPGERLVGERGPGNKAETTKNNRGLREEACQGVFADALRSAKKQRMRNAPGAQCAAQRSDNLRIAAKFREAHR